MDARFIISLDGLVVPVKTAAGDPTMLGMVRRIEVDMAEAAKVAKAEAAEQEAAKRRKGGDSEAALA